MSVAPMVLLYPKIFITPKLRPGMHSLNMSSDSATFVSTIKTMIAKNKMNFVPLLEKVAVYPKPRNSMECDANYNRLVELCGGDEALARLLMT